MLKRLKNLLQDPPPLAVFELSDGWAAAVRRNTKTFAVEARAERPLPEGVIEASATKPNVLDPDALDAVVAELVEEIGEVKRPEAALILPDGCARMTVLDFEQLPGDRKERTALLRSRLAKTVPFDLDSAQLSFDARKTASGWSVLATTALEGVVRQYEEAVERAGFWPGWVSLSSAATLSLVPDEGAVMLAKLSGRDLTMSAVEGGTLRMLRTVAMTAPADASPRQVVDEMAADLYPTIVFTGDNLDAKVERLLLCGFGDLLPAALEEFPNELECKVEALRSSEGPVGPADAGIWGYLSAN